MKFRRTLRGLLLLGLVAGAAGKLRAAEAITPGQQALGSLQGVTVGPDGKPVADVGVVIRGVDGKSERRVLSDGTGAFAAPDLPLGRYELTAFKQGFGTAPAVTVEVAQNQVVQASVALVADTRSPSAGLEADSQPITEREKRLLDRIDGLEQRLAAMEAKESTAPKPTPAAEPNPALTASTQPAAAPSAPQKPVEVAQAATPQTPLTPKTSAPEAPTPAAPAVDNQTPFAFGDFTWLNGTPRNKDVVVDTPFFTPEVRFDTHYMEDFNQPIDHTIVGATESFRSGEVQIEQASVGGDFHWQGVRGRILFMQGLFASTTPRNDASSATGSAGGNTGGVGQWDLQSAYKYVSEAWGGYHFNVNHGLNVDAGIFVSYIGLFSYYNFDNWTYQPSYVSSNTPWFFNGLRVQWFPTNKLKIEPWVINGWQSYAKFNGHPGLGGQILWQPNEWFKLVANQYGFGQDNLGLPHTERIHTDDSIEVRYFNRPESTGLSKMAFSLTGDAGVQYGGGLCGTCAPSKGKESFVGWMLYDRYWFHKDTYAITFGGGQMSNYGRYLTLLPPINGAWAASGSPYFPELPGQPAHMWDSTITFQYMPKQYITWWAEVGYRHSDIPYFAGRGGVTPPGGNNGLPQYFTCMSGASSGTGDLTAATAACGAGNVWFPDLRHSEAKLSLGVMVKF